MNVVIFVTAPNKEEAGKIADKLIRDKLAACVNIIAGVESVFRWEGKIERANEALLIIKSTEENQHKIINTVKSLHSYEVPEIICMRISAGFKPYLDWINESVRKPG